MTKPSIKTIKNSRRGIPGFVLGGGYDLERDLLSYSGPCAAPNSPLIGINGHAMKIGIPVEFVVFLDHPKFKAKGMAWRTGMSAKAVTPIKEETDFSMEGVSPWNVGKSFSLGVWLAVYLGCDPVVLCGFDLFTLGGGHAGDPASKPNREAFTDQIERWCQLSKMMNDVERCRIVAVSGPLVHMFGQSNKKSI